MTAKKVIRITITKEERKILKKTEKILQEVCDAIDDKDCKYCPFYKLCCNRVCQLTPDTMLSKYISVLPVED